MKVLTLVQANGNELNVAYIEKQVKEEVKLAGYKVKDIKSLNIYVKPVENEVYYTVTFVKGDDLNKKLGE